MCVRTQQMRTLYVISLSESKHNLIIWQSFISAPLGVTKGGRVSLVCMNRPKCDTRTKILILEPVEWKVAFPDIYDGCIALT
jgi:hypothetical protein